MKTLIILLILIGTSASAQTIIGDRFELNTGPCMIRSGVGSPEATVVGNICDVYINTSDGVIWAKWTGTNTSVGWFVGFNSSARINGNTTITGFVGDQDYVSQLTGWRIDDLGGADFRYLFTDQLHAKSFTVDLEQALAGAQIITKSVATLASNFTVPVVGGVATLIVNDLPSAENMRVFEVGDMVRLRSLSRASGTLTVADAYGVVSAYVDEVGGTQRWTFTRASGASGGTLATGSVIQADSLVLDYGVSGNGFIEQNAIDGVYGINSPYIQAVTWSGGSPISANLAVRARLGNLRGITAINNEYGLIAGNYSANQFFRASNTSVELVGVNFSMYDGATRTIFLDRTAPSLAIGSPTPSAYGTGTGIWMGNSGGIYRFRVGNPAGNVIAWDGSTLTVNGTITATAGTIGGWRLGPSTLEDTAGIVGMASTVTGGDDVRFWAGNNSPTAAPFRVTEAGVLTATSATITGAITATSGSFTGNGSGVTNINGGNITANTITGTQIAADTITASEIAADSIQASELDADSVNASHIQAGAVTASEISVSTLSAITANMGTLTAGAINGGSININGNFVVNSSGAVTVDALDVFEIDVSSLDLVGEGSGYVCATNGVLSVNPTSC